VLVSFVLWGAQISGEQACQERHPERARAPRPNAYCFIVPLGTHTDEDLSVELVTMGVDGETVLPTFRDENALLACRLTEVPISPSRLNP
jgi:hypothetical protein